MYWDCVRSFIWGILYIFVTFYFSERGKAGLRSLRFNLHGHVPVCFRNSDCLFQFHIFPVHVDQLVYSCTAEYSCKVDDVHRGAARVFRLALHSVREV